MMYCLRLLLCVCFISGILCKRSNASDTSRVRILFIGNSLIYTNNLPELVKEIAMQDAVMMHTTSLCFPNYSLEDHWNEGRIQKEIIQGKYNFVVAQQGPSALTESQVLLMEYAKRIAALCKANNSRFCLLTVWPSKDRSFDFNGVIASYKKSAQKTGSLLAAAGAAWQLACQSDASLKLYGSDGFHPSINGSLLAAITVYATIKQKTNLDFLHRRDSSWQEQLTEHQLNIFKAAALQSAGKGF